MRSNGFVVGENARTRHFWPFTFCRFRGGQASTLVGSGDVVHLHLRRVSAELMTATINEVDSRLHKNTEYCVATGRPFASRLKVVFSAR